MTEEPRRTRKATAQHVSTEMMAMFMEMLKVHQDERRRLEEEKRRGEEARRLEQVDVRKQKNARLDDWNEKKKDATNGSKRCNKDRRS